MPYETRWSETGVEWRYSGHVTAAETRLAEIRDAMTEYLRHADLEDSVAAQSAWTDLMRLINPNPATT